MIKGHSFIEARFFRRIWRCHLLDPKLRVLHLDRGRSCQWILVISAESSVYVISRPSPQRRSQIGQKLRTPSLHGKYSDPDWLYYLRFHSNMFDGYTWWTSDCCYFLENENSSNVKYTFWGVKYDKSQTGIGSQLHVWCDDCLQEAAPRCT